MSAARRHQHRVSRHFTPPLTALFKANVASLRMTLKGASFCECNITYWKCLSAFSKVLSNSTAAYSPGNGALGGLSYQTTRRNFCDMRLPNFTRVRSIASRQLVGVRFL